MKYDSIKIFAYMLIGFTYYVILSKKYQQLFNFTTSNPETTLLRWMKSNGAYISPKLKIKYLFKDNRYIVADEYIKTGETLVIVPDNLIIRYGKSSVSNLCKVLGIKNYQICISYYICSEMKKKDSPFKTFFEFLPNDYYNYPYFFSPKQKEYLENTKVLEKIHSWKKLFRRDYNIFNVIQNGINIQDSKISIEDYEKCRHIVWSRDFGIDVNSTKDISLVPFADLFNYAPNKINAYWFYNSTYDQEDGRFMIVANHDIKKGDEIILSYGEKESSEFFIFYGFIPQDNPIKLNYNIHGISLSNPPDLILDLPQFHNSLEGDASNIADYIKTLESMKKKLKELLQGYNKEINLGIKSDEFIMSNIYTVVLEEKQFLMNYIQVIEKSLKRILSTGKGLMNWVTGRNTSQGEIRNLLLKLIKDKST